MTASRPVIIFLPSDRYRIQEGEDFMFTQAPSRRSPVFPLALALAIALVGLLLGTLGVGQALAQEVLTNDSVISMVKAGLPESVIISKISSSPKKFDTSTDGLIKLKAAKVPDKVIEAMVTGGAPAAASTASQADPMIAYVSPAGAKPLKIVHGEMESSAAPFAGSRHEVVLPAPRADYRITDRQPVFQTNLAADQWALIRLKPGKNDRNLPIDRNSGWGWGGATFRTGPDPKYRVSLDGAAAPGGGATIKPKEPLAPGEYGWIAIWRGQPNMVEVFEFGVD
jgi:hypothetical protein